jgi:hypothetical protein
MNIFGIANCGEETSVDQRRDCQTNNINPE